MKYCLDYNTHFVKIILQKYYKHKCYIVTIVLDKPKKIFQLSLQQYFLFLPRTTSAENRYLHYLLPSQCRNYRLDPPLLTSKLTDTVQTVPNNPFQEHTRDTIGISHPLLLLVAESDHLLQDNQQTGFGRKQHQLQVQEEMGNPQQTPRPLSNYHLHIDKRQGTGVFRESPQQIIKNILHSRQAKFAVSNQNVALYTYSLVLQISLHQSNKIIMKLKYVNNNVQRPLAQNTGIQYIEHSEAASPFSVHLSRANYARLHRSPISEYVPSPVSYKTSKKISLRQEKRSHTVLIGGGEKQEEANHSPLSNNFIYPVNTRQAAPLYLAQLTTNYNHDFRPHWKPPILLETLLNDHPFSNLLTRTTLRQIIMYSQETPQLICAYSSLKTSTVITTAMFRQLISHNSSIHDDVVALFLEVLCTRFDMCFLSPQFIPKLLQDGWDRITKYFVTPRKPRSVFRPNLTGEKALAIPCFVDRCHWVPLVRREYNGDILFLYADDLNNPSTEVFLKETLSKTSTDFFPPNAKWIHCHSYTYHPHSNECGPRTLLALTIMMLHPYPDQKMLLPFMHHNLANITRTWVAATIITGSPLIPPLSSPSLIESPHSTTAISKPSYLLPWNENPAHIELIRQPQSTQLPPLEVDNMSVVSNLNTGQNSPSIRETTDSPSDISISSFTNTPRCSISMGRKLTSSNTNQNLLSAATSSPNSSHIPCYRSQPGCKFSTNTTYDRTQPKITDYFSATSRVNSTLLKEPTSTRKSTKQSKSKDKSKPLSSPQPLPTLFDLPICKPLHHQPENELPLWGHSLETIDPDKTLRIILQNPNGIKTNLSDHDFHFSLSTCHQIGAGILCLAETNTNWNMLSQPSNTHRIMRKVWTTSNLQVSQGKESFKSSYQPGGTLTAIVGRWTSRVISKGVDPHGLGRWSYITIRGKGDKIITVITGYRVCSSTLGSIGEKTAYKQQFRHLSQKWREHNFSTTPDPHRQFILDLQSWIEALISKNHEIILSLDNNEDITLHEGTRTPIISDSSKPVLSTTHDGSLTSLAQTCGLLDILGKQHSERPFPATYSRGKKRLDYILVSSSIAHSVTHSGILPYQSIFHSDHRACYIDIDPDILFQESTHEILPPCRRGLQLTDPRKVNKYKGEFFDQLSYHKIIEKQRDLFQIAEADLWSEDYILDYEKVDKLNSEAMVHAERSGPKFTNTYDWSPPLIQAIQSVRYWRLLLKRSKGQRVAQSTIDRTREAAGLPLYSSDQYTRLYIVNRLREALLTRHSLRKNHRELRISYLTQIATAKVLNRASYLEGEEYSEERERRTKKEIKEMMKREVKKYQYRKIGQTLTPQDANNRGLSRINIPASDIIDPYPIGPDPKTWKGPWRSISDPSLIAKHVCAANKRQYNQAHQTPFGTGYLADMLNLDASTEEAKNLLRGSFTPDQEFIQLQETTDILNQLSTPLPLIPKDITAVITPEQFSATYKIVKEATSSSPSGRHVGHYKVAATDPLLSELHSAMMSIPYMTGFSPSRWQQVVDVMLEKDPGVPHVHRLRIIALLESDYNQANRIILARQLGFRLEDNNLISSMQHGSRPGKQCISAVLNKQLTYDIVRHSKTTAAFIENDAVGCYDRLINPILLLQLLRLGAPPTTTKSLSQTWENTNHRIRTQFGVSEESYGYTCETPLFGPGQGSTIGPFLWLLCFCLIADALGSNAPSMVFTSTDNTVTITNTGDAFVDDAYLGTTSTHNPPPAEPFATTQKNHKDTVIANLQFLGQKWERLLFTTGGAINLQKSFWILMSWDWSKGRAILSTPSTSTDTLLLTEGYNITSPIEVPRLSPYSSYKTLGVYISPSGSSNQACLILKGKAIDYGVRLMGSHLNREEALWSYLLYFIPRIGFPLPALSLTEKQCNAIQSPALKGMLPKLHLNQHTARSILYGPELYGGLNLPNAYLLQCSGQLKLLIGHLRSRDKTSNLIIISMSNIQILVGSNTPFFHLQYSKYGKWIEHSWLTSLWQFVSRVRFTLKIKRAWYPHLPRSNDVMLMDYFLSLNYKPQQLESLNRCRIFLQVLSLSDIVSADGRLLIVPTLSGNKLTDRRSTLKWPDQQKPPPTEWSLWTSALNTLHRNGILIKPLTTWLSVPHQSWFWFMDPSSSILFHNVTNRWFLHAPLPQRTIRRTRSSTKKIYSKNSSQETLPPNHILFPATIVSEEDKDYIEPNVGTTPLPSLPATDIEQTSSFLEQLWSHPFYKRLLGPIQNPVDEYGRHIAESLASGTLLACSDGSYSPITRKGSHGWVLATTESQLWKGAGPVDGHPELISPYRAELSGLVALLHVLNSVSTYFDVTSGEAIIYCDCLSAIRHLKPRMFGGLKDHLVPDYDLLNEGRNLLAKLSNCCNIKLTWVKGHYQENKKTIEHKLNDTVHDLAYQYLKNTPGLNSSRKQVIDPPSYEISVLFDGSTLTSKLQQFISSQLYSKSLQDTICKNENWTCETFQLVDWNAYQKAFTSASRSHRISLCKISHRLVNTNSQNKKYYNKPDICPCCNLLPETFAHVLNCSSDETSIQRKAQQQLLKTKLLALQTPSPIVNAILQGLQQWERQQLDITLKLRAPTYGSVQPLSVAITQAFTEQSTKISWESFLRGRISKKWGKAYAQATNSRGLPFTTWTSSVVTILLSYSSAAWDTRNSILHGKTFEEQRAKEISLLATKISNAYAKYSENPFIVPSHLRSLFTSRTLIQRLSQDIDSLQCWLRSYNEGVLTQQEHTRRSAEAAKKFFQPRCKTSPKATQPIQHMIQSSGNVSSQISQSQSEPTFDSDTSSDSSHSISSDDCSSSSRASTVFSHPL
jgi:hypothetical protein